MADFPPAQYIDGYSATGNTISFTIAGYTGKKVESVSVTDGGSYTTPSASVAISGGSGSGALGVCSLELKSLDLTSIGATSLICTSEPNSVSVNLSGNSSASPLYGLQSASPTSSLYYNINTTPTVSGSGENGTNTDAQISLDSTSSLHVASLVTPIPATEGGIYPTDQDDFLVQIVDASAPSTVLATASITTNSAGSIVENVVQVNDWITPQSKADLLARTLKLKTTVPSYLITSFTTSTQFYHNRATGETPSISVSSANVFADSTTTIAVYSLYFKPITFSYEGVPFVAGTSGYWTGTLEGNIYDQEPTEGYLPAGGVAYISSGSSVATGSSYWNWNGVSQSYWMYNVVSGIFTTYQLTVVGVIPYQPSPYNLVSLTLGGRYDTPTPTLAITNLYTDPECTTLA